MKGRGEGGGEEGPTFPSSLSSFFSFLSFDFLSFSPLSIFTFCFTTSPNLASFSSSLTFLSFLNDSVPQSPFFFFLMSLPPFSIFIFLQALPSYFTLLWHKPDCLPWLPVFSCLFLAFISFFCFFSYVPLNSC